MFPLCIHVVTRRIKLLSHKKRQADSHNNNYVATAVWACMCA